ncbi:hypothetical protein BN2475_1050001 [Paraburkholderia ribeironis]|uniref:Uncharacterized protein n=1 Tax=Paraburkholderia ribeironis TaxID=1247936 RepID=A0A1N7SMD5_9BURK|nr:hypothetical protein BN2475_1050001 [Paraburkholderia ribeironis]
MLLELPLELLPPPPPPPPPPAFCALVVEPVPPLPDAADDADAVVVVPDCESDDVAVEPDADDVDDADEAESLPVVCHAATFVAPVICISTLLSLWIARQAAIAPQPALRPDIEPLRTIRVSSQSGARACTAPGHLTELRHSYSACFRET